MFELELFLGMSNFRTQHIDKQLKKASADLCKLPMQESEMAYLVSKDTSHIYRLILFYNGLSLTTLQILPKGHWSRLTNLQISHNNIGDHSCKYISKMGLILLNDLSLNENEITGVGVLHLAKSDWKHLFQASFYSNKLSVNSIKYLLKGNFQKITRLEFASNRLTWIELIQLAFLSTNKLQELYYGHNTPFDAKQNSADLKKVQKSIDQRYVNIFSF